jgi:wyosine [tRNA(Phe)-imidazoG37] synthetase (radical SAM superfamily)
MVRIGKSMKILSLQKGAVYGPIASRRLGPSLGINVLPVTCKVCTFNCLYCQYGWTAVHGTGFENEDQWPAVTDILREVRRSLQSISPKPGYVTFSGNGEPTLHPSFDEIVEGVIGLRDLYSPKSKTAILSNSTTVGDSGIRKAISKLDVAIMKLDCGSEAVFSRYNRPCFGIELERIVEGLTCMNDVHVQALFTGGDMGNYRHDEIDAWMQCIRRIEPVQVQLYTLDRGYPSGSITPLRNMELIEIKEKLERENIHTAEVFS